MRDEKECFSSSLMPHPSSLLSDRHDVVAAIHMYDFACDAGRERAAQEESAVADLARLDVASQGCALGVMFEHHAQVCHTAARSESVERPGADCVDANIALAKIGCQV